MENDSDVRFYSKNAVLVASFLGGPLAGSFAMRHNFIHLGEKELGEKALKWGLISSICFLFASFVLLFFSVPNQFISLALLSGTVGAMSFFVDTFQAEALERHKKSNGLFQAPLMPVFIGLLFAFIVTIPPTGYSYYLENKVESLIHVLDQNEQRAVSYIKSESPESILNHAVPLYEENIEITVNLRNKMFLKDSFKTFMIILGDYYSMKLKYCEIFAKSLESEDDTYSSELENLEQELSEVMQQIQRFRMT